MVWLHKTLQNLCDSTVLLSALQRRRGPIMLPREKR